MRDTTLGSPIDNLRKDLYAVARDAEALLKATAQITNQQVQEIRARTERTLRETLDHLDTERMQRMARRTGRYVRDNSWTVIGAAAGIGLIVGLIAWRARSDRRRHDMRLSETETSERETTLESGEETQRRYGAGETGFGAHEAQTRPD